MRLTFIALFAFIGLYGSVSGQDASGVITVRVRGAQPELPVTVKVEWRRGGKIGTVAPGDPPVVTKTNLEFDTYYVSAVQDNGLAAAIETVRIDRERPAATVEIELLENRSSVLVTDEQWNQVRNAKAIALSPAQYYVRANYPSRTEVAPGEFSLDGLPPGMYVRIRAEGFSPACVMVPRNDRALVRLEIGRTVEVRLPRDLTPAVVKELSALAGIPGSDCPVPLAEFRPQVSADYVLGQPGTYRFDHFPSASRFELIRFPSQPRQIVVPDRGDAIVETLPLPRVP